MLPIRSTLSPAPDDTNASGRPSPLGVPALPSYSNFYLSSDEIITPLISDIAFPSVNPPIVLYLNPSFKDSFDGKDDANMENLPGGRVKRLRNLTQAQVKAINSDQTNGHNKKNILKVVAETKIVYHVWIEDGEATEGGDKEVENIEAAQSNKTTGNEVAVKGISGTPSSESSTAPMTVPSVESSVEDLDASKPAAPSKLSPEKPEAQQPMPLPYQIRVPSQSYEESDQSESLPAAKRSPLVDFEAEAPRVSEGGLPKSSAPTNTKPSLKVLPRNSIESFPSPSPPSSPSSTSSSSSGRGYSSLSDDSATQSDHLLSAVDALDATMTLSMNPNMMAHEPPPRSPLPSPPLSPSPNPVVRALKSLHLLPTNEYIPTSPPPSPPSSPLMTANIKTIPVPPGVVGLTFTCHADTCVVTSVSTDSTLVDRVYPGDIFLGLDEFKVTTKNVKSIVSIMKKRQNYQRIIRVLSTA